MSSSRTCQQVDGPRSCSSWRSHIVQNVSTTSKRLNSFRPLHMDQEQPIGYGDVFPGVQGAGKGAPRVSPWQTLKGGSAVRLQSAAARNELAGHVGHGHVNRVNRVNRVIAEKGVGIVEKAPRPPYYRSILFCMCWGGRGCHSALIQIKEEWGVSQAAGPLMREKPVDWIDAAEMRARGLYETPYRAAARKEHVFRYIIISSEI
ncbi:unnamed protein product [Spirodela intermedia]|uniref:Uncharacterized protein n=1 Tax=Spirodela intermedia TaxID=51605 RepID=A0A7I8JAM6_SPIIN|nr:unnamed protein product [Spirodela intermedia]CAA6667170.1 unnamed protein product [Spirodela intermedia]